MSAASCSSNSLEPLVAISSDICLKISPKHCIVIILTGLGNKSTPKFHCNVYGVKNDAAPNKGITILYYT